MNEEVRTQIAGLSRLSTTALNARYQELIGTPAPCSNPRRLLRRMGWKLQAQAEGELSDRALDRAKQLAQGVDLRLRPSNVFGEAGGDNSGSRAFSAVRDKRLPAPGTVLRRSYKDQVLAVEVLERGFHHNGQTYNSLSAIAFHATGTRWNGFSFFGLNAEVRHA